MALGGGAAAQPGVVERLLASGTLVYLRARPETLAARVGDDAARPLLAGLDAEARLAKLRRLLAEREPSYLRARVVVDTDALDAAGAAAELVARRLGAAPDERAGAARGRVEVALGERSYTIEIGLGTLDELGAAVKRVVAPYARVRWSRRRRWAGAGRARALASLRERRAARAPLRRAGRGAQQEPRAGRRASTTRCSPPAPTAARWWWRSAAGVVGDLAGFVAATLLRGLPVVQVPTSPARDGRFERRRQDRRQRGARQEPGRRLPPAPPGLDRRRHARDAAAAPAPRRAWPRW